MSLIKINWNPSHKELRSFGIIAIAATLLIDGEAFRMTAKDGHAQIRAGAAESPDVVMTTSYEPMMALADGEIDQSDFVSNHMTLEVHTPGKQAEFIDLLAQAIQEFD